MSEEEFNKICQSKNEYEIANQAISEWLDYVYDTNRIRYSDDYYNVKIEKKIGEYITLKIHLPTIINAMEHFTEEKKKIFQQSLKGGTKDE